MCANGVPKPGTIRGREESMTDPATISAAAAVGKLFSDVFGLLSKPKLDPPQILAKVSELHVQFQGVVQESAEKTETIRDLRARLRSHEGMKWQHNVYWRGEGDSREGPFCPSCLDGKGQAIRMATSRQRWRCTSCGHSQDTPERMAELERLHHAISEHNRRGGPWGDSTRRR
jgi:hypothetical protein